MANTKLEELIKLYPEKDYHLLVYTGKINEYWKFCGVITKLSSIRKLKKDIKNYIIYEPIMEFLIVINDNQLTYYHSTPEWFTNELTLRLPTIEEFVDTIDTDRILDYSDPKLCTLLKEN
jgi:hypothetical protein